MTSGRLNRYQQIIERIFSDHYQPDAQEIEFDRSEITSVAAQLGVQLPRNLGDLVYSFRYRAALPESVRSKAPEGKVWIIRPAGRARYRFVAIKDASVVPNSLMAATKVPDATPGIIAMYALGDEPALLAKLRYNRLIDTFSGVTCYSLQSHVRTALPNLGQLEIDEIYVGIDRRGAHHVLPVEAKGANEQIGVVQVEQDFVYCAAKFPSLVCRPIGAQLLGGDVIVLYAFEETPDGVAISTEKHYRLVPSSALSAADLESYRDNLPLPE